MPGSADRECQRVAAIVKKKKADRPYGNPCLYVSERENATNAVDDHFHARNKVNSATNILTMNVKPPAHGQRSLRPAATFARGPCGQQFTRPMAPCCLGAIEDTNTRSTRRASERNGAGRGPGCRSGTRNPCVLFVYKCESEAYWGLPERRMSPTEPRWANSVLQDPPFSLSVCLSLSRWPMALQVYIAIETA